MAKFRNIDVLTSGGDAPGMNALIRSVARAALEQGVEVYGVYEGFQGLMDDLPADPKSHFPGSLIKLDAYAVTNIIDKGATMLKSARAPEFKTEEGMAKAIATCRRHNIDGIVAIGGDGTFRGATDLTNRGIPCIGLPATIDNDITATDESIGFDTALNTAVELIDKLRDTCESHARCNVIELMGRNAGYIALEAGIAAGASAILTCECPYSEEEIFENIINAKNQGKRSFIVVIAEGVKFKKEEEGIKNYCEDFAKRLEAATGVETKFCRPAHILRGGIPTPRDRVLASRMGYEAVRLLLEGKSKLVVCKQKSDIISLDINYALILDRMYKNNLKPGDLDAFTAEEQAEMRAFCAAKAAEFAEMYKVANAIAAYPESE